MGEYKNKQFHCRMKYSTYLRLRKIFKAQRGESAASYFERLSKWLESENSSCMGDYEE